MLWVECESYFGADRRRKPAGLRLLERRRCNYAGNAPPLATALRQLRMRVLDAHGPGAQIFCDRAKGVALLARINGGPELCDALSHLATIAARGEHADVRPNLYAALDRAQSLLEH